MKFLLILFSIICFTGNIPIIHGENKLPISIYYESLCPDSTNFITGTLNVEYNDIKDYVDVHFVPFGKSIIYENQTFWCQHGPAECEGNMIQSCTLYALQGRPDAQMEYINCQMTTGSDKTGRTCSDLLNVNWMEVYYCVYGGLGLRLQMNAERETHKIRVPYPAFVPTIVYNNVFDHVLQNRSLTDFLGVVCELINNAASVCTTRN